MLLMPGGHERYLGELASLESSGRLTESAASDLGARFGVSMLPVSR